MAEGPMSTPRRPEPRSSEAPMIAIRFACSGAAIATNATPAFGGTVNRMRLVLALGLTTAALVAATTGAEAATASYVIQSDRSAGGIVIARSKPAAAFAR